MVSEWILLMAEYGFTGLIAEIFENSGIRNSGEIAFEDVNFVGVGANENELFGADALFDFVLLESLVVLLFDVDCDGVLQNAVEVVVVHSLRVFQALAFLFLVELEFVLVEFIHV